jgi:hypothetical protein
VSLKPQGSDRLEGTLEFQVWTGPAGDEYCGGGVALGTLALKRTGDSRSTLSAGTLRLPAYDKPSESFEYEITVARFPGGAAGYHATSVEKAGTFTLMMSSGDRILIDGSRWKLAGPPFFNADGSEPDESWSWLDGNEDNTGNISGNAYSFVGGKMGRLIGPFTLTWQ